MCRRIGVFDSNKNIYIYTTFQNANIQVCSKEFPPPSSNEESLVDWKIKMNSELNFFERWMPPSIGSRVRFRRRITRNIKPLLFTWRKKKRSKIILVSRVNGGKN